MTSRKRKASTISYDLVLSEMKRNTKLLQSQISQLGVLFDTADTSEDGELSPEEFSRLMYNIGFTNDAIIAGMFRAFDADGTGSLDRREFMTTMGMMMRGTLSEKMDFCFRVYDMNQDGEIDRRECRKLLTDSFNVQKAFNPNAARENVDEIVEAILAKLDKNRDGGITFDEYRSVVLRDPLVLQIVGQCLLSVEEDRTGQLKVGVDL
eukprot:ANDGO_02815.mRNA.1 Neurocalcin homolog